MRNLITRALFVACGVGIVALPRSAHATTILEVADNGSEQLGRGGAWVARASDPLAAFYNPAGLAGQPSRVVLQDSLAISRACYTRSKSTTDPTEDGVAPGAAYPRVCDGAPLLPTGQIAIAYRVSDRLGIGAALLGPSAVPRAKWPDFTPGTTSPAPQRY